MIKVLWITNSLFPEANAKLQGLSEIKGTGGWMIGLADAMIQAGEIEITVASITEQVKDLTIVKGVNLKYYAIPSLGDSTYNKHYEEVYRKIYDEVKPNLVHIHGTEFPHSLAALRACGSRHTVVSLQGIVSVIARYYLAGLTRKEILKCPTLHDFLRHNLFQQKSEMEKRGLYEQNLFEEASYIIGRTSWDRSHVWAVNPKAYYFHCNEVLRQEFYEGDIWSYQDCVKYSIFLSQGNYPLKGIHKVLEALAIVKRSYPSLSVRIAGIDITCSKGGLKAKLKITTYGKIIKKLIKEKDLVKNVVFLGPLNAEGMKKEYLSANVFICPSSIENSPNSLCEAQILGVPTLASYAGGIPDLMIGNQDYLYRYEEVEMLAKSICKIFRNQNIDTSYMRNVAKKRHDINTIVSSMMEIYQEVSSN